MSTLVWMKLHHHLISFTRGFVSAPCVLELDLSPPASPFLLGLSESPLRNCICIRNIQRDPSALLAHLTARVGFWHGLGRSPRVARFCEWLLPTCIKALAFVANLLLINFFKPLNP